MSGKQTSIARMGLPMAILVLTLGISMNTNAGLFGSSGTNWKEEVLLHDGRKIIVERSHSYGGSREIGQPPSIKEQDITFTVPGSKQSLTWKDEYGKDVGGSNFNLLALHILKSTPYVVTTPNLCLSYNKWGRPNPPYVVFKHDGVAWQRIPLSGLPLEFKEINLAVVSTKADEQVIENESPMSVELRKKFNAGLASPEYKTILREALPKERCPQYSSGPKAPSPIAPSGAMK